MAVKLGWMLVNANIITEAQLQETLDYQKKQGGKLGFNLVKLGFCTEEDITQFLSQQYGVPSVNLRHFEIDEEVYKLIPAEVAQKYLIMPLSRSGATLTIAMVDPTNVFAMDDIKFMTGYNVEPVVSSEMAIKESIEKYYGSSHSLELKKFMDEMAASTSDELEVLEDDEELDM
jgi:type IV pilus assembly protein PilB